MRHIKKFEDFINEGIVVKKFSDSERAKSLIENSDETYDMLKIFIKSAGISDKTANHIVKNSYDSIMERIRSEMILQGFSSTGIKAHEAEISFMKKIGFSDNDVELSDTLRYYRNGILYYGTKVDKEFAEKVIELLERVIKNIK